MNINQHGIERLKSFSEIDPVFMMNFLNYKDLVSSTGKTGVETYKDYMKAAYPFF